MTFCSTEKRDRPLTDHVYHFQLSRRTSRLSCSTQSHLPGKRSGLLKKQLIYEINDHKWNSKTSQRLDCCMYIYTVQVTALQIRSHVSTTIYQSEYLTGDLYWLRERGRNYIVGHQKVWPDSDHKPKLEIIFNILHIVKISRAMQRCNFSGFHQVKSCKQV